MKVGDMPKDVRKFMEVTKPFIESYIEKGNPSFNLDEFAAQLLNQKILFYGVLFDTK